MAHQPLSRRLELQSLQPLTYSGLLYLRERRYKCHHRCLYDSHYDSYCNGRYNLLRRPLRLQLRLNHESEAARRAQRTKSSGRGGRRLLVVVILWPLTTKKASMPTVHGFKGFRIAQMYRL
ncbi:hypothetical protein V8E54_000617 [Elaphomyces granulatus]